MKNRVIITALALLCAIVFFSTAANAQEYISHIYLKNGDTATGTIIEQNAEALKLQTFYGVIEIKTEDIKNITFAKAGEDENKVKGAKNIGMGADIVYVLSNKYIESDEGINVYFDYEGYKRILLRTSVGGYSAYTAENEITKGDYSLLWIEESVLIRPEDLSVYPSVYPYFGGGLGYYLTDLYIDDIVKNNLERQGIRLEEDIDDTLSVHLLGGVQGRLNKYLSVNAYFKLVRLKTYVTTAYTYPTGYGDTRETEDIDLTTSMIGIGLSCSF